MTRDVSIESPIEEKIAWAERCLQGKGPALFGDQEIASLLKRLGEAVRDSHGEMVRAGVRTVCTVCAEEEGGSCCGIGLERKYTGILLLINLLLGRSMPGRRGDPSGCFFLGKEGCGLLARQVICINYLCRKITGSIDPRLIASLREKEGIELDLLFRLQERIRKLL
jgi:hypothetical protein